MIDFTKKIFGIISLGCDKNRVDSEKLLAIIKERGCTVSDNIEEVQILIVNTCAFLNESRKEGIETVLSFSKYKKDVLEKIVVCGCLPQKYANEVFEGLQEGDVFIGTYDYDKFFEVLENSYLRGRVVQVGNSKPLHLTDKRLLTTPSHYAYLKIADGCNNHCTYCLIPKIRGAYTSYPIEQLISECENLGEISELILVAQDITRYGVDLYGEKKLCEILKKLTALDNINSVRLLYCYPDMIDDNLIYEIKNNKKIIKYLDIPLQHSENRILKLMNRKGSREEYISLIKKLRKEIPEIALRSTFILGFPTETEEELEGVISFLEEVKLDNCGFFAYSREPDTPAFKLKGQIRNSIKKKRVERLYQVQSEISLKKLHALVGKKIKVLCDGINYKKSCFEGRGYFSAPDIDGKVYFNAYSAVQGQYYDILVTNVDSYDIYGHTEDYKL